MSMDFDLSNFDENDGIDGMETVIATVSGYHGAERFQLIKLIALTGANYVGSFSKSTTHMVCWELRGKKYELAKSLGTKVVSHQWFEDCLKEKKRLPEGPYIMICGKQVGHLSLKIPDRSSHGKRKCELVIKKRKMLHDRSNIYCNYGDLDVGCSTYDDINRIGLCHTYIPESSLSSMISAKGKNKNINTYSDVQITDVDSLRRGLGQQPESSSSSMIFAKGRSKKNNTYNCVETSIDVHPVRRRRRLVKTNAYPDCIDCIDLECDETKEPCAPEQSIIQDSAGIVNTRTVAECCNLQENVTREFVDINLSSSTSPGQNMAHMNCLKESSTRISATGNTREFEIDLSSIHSDHLTTSELGQLAADGSSSLNENCYSVASNDKERKGNDELDEFSILTDLSCVICLTSFSSTRGVLPCGHRFCYSCIESWADHMVSSEKTPTCPLCKVSFTSVTKVEGAVSSDQKIFSQTVPASTSNTDVFVFPNGEDRGIHAWTALNGGESVCSECRNREPEDLLLSCHVCSRQWVHSCCLDPPLVPWTCIHCRDSRMLYLLSR